MIVCFLFWVLSLIVYFLLFVFNFETSRAGRNFSIIQDRAR